MADQPFKAPSPLTSEHAIATFSCGVEALDEFLKRHALSNQSGGSSRTFVAARDDNSVVGYYSLATVSVGHENAPERVRKGQPRHPIPGVLMARFAVDVSTQGKGLGKALFRDAMMRVLGIADQVGVRVFVVDAKNDDALRFYEQYHGMPAPDAPHRLFWLLKDLTAIVGP